MASAQVHANKQSKTWRIVRVWLGLERQDCEVLAVQTSNSSSNTMLISFHVNIATDFIRRYFRELMTFYR